MELASVLSSVQSGKAQLVGGSIIAMDERKEMMDFVLYHPASFVMVVRGTADESSGHNSDSSFLSRLYGSFYRTFVKDDRYKMVLSGLGLTVLMSLSSGVIGLILAYLLVLLRHKNHRISNSLIAVYESRDVPGMLAGLQEFCSRQMMGPKATRNTVLAVEELAVSRILPVLDRGKKGRVKLILQSEEGGVNRILSIDCGSLPGGEEVVLRETDEISSAILRNIVRRLPEKESRGTLRYEILYKDSLTIEEAAEYSNIGVSRIRDLCKE